MKSFSVLTQGVTLFGAEHREFHIQGYCGRQWRAWQRAITGGGQLHDTTSNKQNGGTFASLTERTWERNNQEKPSWEHSQPWQLERLCACSYSETIKTKYGSALKTLAKLHTGSIKKGQEPHCNKRYKQNILPNTS